MPPNSDLPVPNLFLASLPQDDVEALQPHLERVRLSSGQILHKPQTPRLFRPTDSARLPSRCDYFPVREHDQTASGMLLNRSSLFDFGQKSPMPPYM